MSPGLFDSEDALAQLDAKGYTVFDAITLLRDPAVPSLASPHLFLAVDGHNYWVKVRAQQGLVAELICGRLGHLLGVAPNAAIIRIIKEVVVSHQTAGDLVGILAGTVDVVGTINPKDMGRIAPELKLDEKNVDALSRANVVIFQTWIGAGDPQVLIDPGTGKVLSIDHGGALAPIQPIKEPRRWSWHRFRVCRIPTGARRARARACRTHRVLKRRGNTGGG